MTISTVINQYVKLDVKRYHPIFGALECFWNVDNNDFIYRWKKNNDSKPEKPNIFESKYSEVLLDSSIFTEPVIYIDVEGTEIEMYAIARYHDCVVFSNYGDWRLYFDFYNNRWILREDGMIGRVYYESGFGTEYYTTSGSSLGYLFSAASSEIELNSYSDRDDAPVIKIVKRLESSLTALVRNGDYYTGIGTLSGKTLRIGWGRWRDASTNKIYYEIIPTRRTSIIHIDGITYDATENKYYIGTKGAETGWHETAASNVKFGASITFNFVVPAGSSITGNNITLSWYESNETLDDRSATINCFDTPCWR